MAETLTFCVFIDAFGWELLKRIPFLEGVLPYRSALDTVFGYSSTCDPTIITGRMPRDHGHFAFFYHTPHRSPLGVCRRLGWLPRGLARRGRVRRWISRGVRRYYGYTGYFQLYNMPFEQLHLFDYSEKRDIYEPGGINSGLPTAFDRLREAGIPFHRSDWRAGEHENLAAMKSALKVGKIRFAYLYLAAMDALLHAEGTRSPIVAAKIRWYEDQLVRLIQLAQARYDRVDVLCFSDHGMTDIVGECNLINVIDRLGLTFGRDYVAAYDSTMARFWFMNDRARRAIVTVLDAVPQGRVLSDEDLAAYGCDFPDRRYGELFFLLDPGVLLCPSFMGETRLAGMHGYAPEDKDSVAMFASNVPGLHPRRLDDLHDLMLAGIPELEVSSPCLCLS